VQAERSFQVAGVRHDRDSMFAALRLSDVRRLWLAQATSELGDWAGRVALAGLAVERYNRPSLAAVFIGLTLLGWLGPGQLVATLADRWPRRRVLVVADLSRAVLFAICCLNVPVGVLLAAVALASLATPAFASARSALLPDAAGRLYPEAVKLTTATNQVALALGALAGGALLAWLGPEGALGANSLSFVISAAFLVRLTVGRQPSRVGTSVGKHLAGTWQLLRTDPFLRGAATVAAGASAGLMAAEALAAAVGLDADGAAAAGVFAAAVPVGTIIGALVCPRPADHRHALVLAGLLCLVGGGVGAALFAVGSGWFLAIPFAFVGLAFALVIPTQVIVGDRLVGEYRATGFAVLTGFLLGAQAIGAALGGVIASVTGLRAVCVGGATLAAMVGVMTMIHWRPRHEKVIASATTAS